MKKPKLGKEVVIHSIAGLLSLIAVSACIAAEFKRTKVEDLRLAGKFCSLPGSPAFGLGIAALISLSAAQIVGSSVICRRFFVKNTGVSISCRRKALAITFVALSWLSFVLAIMLLGAGSSMNRKQLYGEGWLDGECYIVKDGMYIWAAALSLATATLMLGSSLAIRIGHRRNGLIQEEREEAKL